MHIVYVDGVAQSPPATSALSQMRIDSVAEAHCDELPIPVLTRRSLDPHGTSCTCTCMAESLGSAAVDYQFGFVGSDSTEKPAVGAPAAAGQPCILHFSRAAASEREQSPEVV